MTRVRSKDLAEAEELLETLTGWSEDEIEALPPLYRERARQYRQLPNSGAD